MEKVKQVNEVKEAYEKHGQEYHNSRKNSAELTF
jgi:hypothetical protein